MLLNLTRNIFQVVLICSLFFLVACGGEGEEPTDEEPPPQGSNSPPVLKGDYLTSLTVDEVYDYTPVASDSDGDILTFTIKNKPDWAEFESTTGRLHGVPAEQDVGEHTDIKVTVDDGEAEDSLETFAITVKHLNRRPKISGDFPATINEGEVYDYTPTASDIDGDPLTFDIQNKPSWANFETTTGRLFGAVSDRDVGSYADIQISVNDGHHSTSLNPFSILVNNVNQPPIITGSFPTSINENETYDYKPTATDNDGDSLIFSIQNKPSWASFETTTGRLYGVVNLQNVGNYSDIQVSVSDGHAVVPLDNFSIEVMKVNHAPTISGVFPTSISEGETYSYTPSATDSDGDTLAFLIQNKPNWANFETATGRLFGVVDTQNIGNYNNIQISVSDGHDTASLNAFSIEVKDVNHAPTISANFPATINEDETYDYTVSAEDSDGDTLTFSILNQPSWASFEKTTGRLFGAVSIEDVGEYTNIQISVSDGQYAAALAPFSIEVKDVNQAPTISADFPTTINEGETYDYTASAEDSDGDTLTFSILNQPSWASFEKTTGRLFGAVSIEDVGEYTNIQISVSDGQYAAALAPFAIEVKDVNYAPTISADFPNTINEDEIYDYTPTAEDSDGDALTFSILNKPSWASFDTTTGRLFGAVNINDVGDHTNIQISVSDEQLIASLESFAIKVKDVNSAPTISAVFPAAINEDETYDYTPTAEDSDGDTLIFSIQNKPSWASFDTATGRLFGTVNIEDVGEYSNIQISVSDDQLVASLEPFTIEVKDVNHAPTISGNFPITIDEDETYDYTPTAEDSDGDPLTFSIQNKPSWASFETATGRLFGAVNMNDIGEHTNVQISVTDGQYVASLAPFIIEVNDVNYAPTISADFPITIDEDETYDYTPTAEDSDGDTLTFSIQNKPSWASFDTASGRLFGAVNIEHVGEYPNIQISVSDGELTTSLDAFSIEVKDINHAPTILDNYPTSINEDEAYNHTPTAEDSDGDTLTFSIQNKPAWASFDAGSGRLYGTPEGDSVGDFSDIQVTVTDGQASNSTEPFLISVSAINHPPTIESQNLSIEITAQLVITLGDLVDEDGDSLTYQIQGTNNTVPAAQSNQVIYVSDLEGTEEFTVIVSDGELTSEATITVIVRALDQVLYYISPTGSDSNNGLSASTPWLSFEHAFNSANGGMSGGDELVLLSGEYSIENGTGILRGADDYGNALNYSAAIPSGVSRSLMTKIRAAVDGGAVVIGSDNIKPISIGRSFRKDRYIEVSGIKFEGGGSMYNSEYVIFRNSGFHGSLSIGTNDHSNGNSYNLIEDVWIWAKNRRIVASNYRANNNVWRRVVLRSEGCDEAGCESAPKADPSVGLTVYDSQDVSIQNVIIIDRLIRNDTPYGDFATAQHTDNSAYHLGRNEWLGNMSINSQDASMTFEADAVLTTGDLIWTIKNFVSVGTAKTGVNIGNVPYNYSAAGKPSSLIENVSVLLSGAGANISGIRVSSGQSTVNVKNSIATGSTRTGYNVLGSSVESSVGYNPGNAEGEFDTNNCIINCVALGSDPLNDGSILYPLQIEENSNVATAISDVDVGAKIIYRQGVTGTFYGDENYNSLSDEELWPWPNEARIKQEMCIDDGVTRGFCSLGTQLNGESAVTLSTYIWEFLGNPIPSGIY